MTLSVRRFAPNTVRQPRNAVRHGLEQVSDSVGMRSASRSASNAALSVFFGLVGEY